MACSKVLLLSGSFLLFALLIGSSVARPGRTRLCDNQMCPADEVCVVSGEGKDAEPFCLPATEVDDEDELESTKNCKKVDCDTANTSEVCVVVGRGREARAACVPQEELDQPVEVETSPKSSKSQIPDLSETDSFRDCIETCNVLASSKQLRNCIDACFELYPEV